MPKLTINDKDYYTDDFNEDQLSMYREISVAREEMSRMQYLMQVLDARCNMLGGMIVEIAEAPAEDQNQGANDGD